MAFYDNLISLCAEKDVSPSGVAREIGLSNAAANGWKKGKKPSDVTLEKLSQYFGVTVEYLLTGEGQKNTAPETGSGESDLDVVLRKLPNLKPADLAIVVKAISECMETE